MTLDQNNLSQLNFRFSFARSPDIEYRAQSVSVPGLNLGVASQPSPFVPIPRPGNLSYDELQISFIAAENLDCYLEIFNWMVALGHPDRLEQHPITDADIYTDMSVIILNSAQRGILNVSFRNAFPTSLSPLTFDATLMEPQYQQVNVNFKFERFYFNAL